MDRRMTTVASFDIAVKAEMARNTLEAAGIDAVIADSETVAMDWLISNAVGGIKVQVWEEDAERAAEILSRKFGDEAGLSSEEVDESELTRQALAAGPAEGEGDVEATSDSNPESSTEDDDAPPARDSYPGPALAAAIASLFVPLIVFYAIYLWINAVAGQGTLSPRGRQLTAIGGLVIIGMLSLWCWLVVVILNRP